MSKLTDRLAGLSPEQRALLVKRFQQRGQQVEGGRIPRRPRTTDTFPLSFAQERLWFVQQLIPDSPLYTSPTTAMRIDGPFYPGILAGALTEMVRRHESLRTTFGIREGRPMQRVAPPAPFRLPVADLTELPEERRQAEALRRVGEEMRRPFHLAAGSLLRLGLFRLAPGIHVLSFAMHHIVSDGLSAGVFFRELWALYRAFCAGLPSPLPEPPVQYVDFAVWQREWLQGEVLERQLEFWKGRLGGTLPVLALPVDRPRPAVQSFRGGLASITLPPDLQAELRAVAQRLRVTPFVLLLTAYGVLLHRFTGEEDLCIGSPIANRRRPELQEMIGCLVNVLVLRADLTGDPPFPELVERVRQMVFEAFENQDLPFEKLVEALQPARALSHSPLFQAAFSFPDNPMRSVELPGAPLSRKETHTGAASFDLVFELLDLQGDLMVAAEYSRDLFDEATVERLTGSYRTLLAELGTCTGQCLSELPILSVVERRQVLEEWNETGAPVGGGATLCDLIAEQAAVAPDAPAASWGGSQLTYRELSARAHQLARHLLAMGIRPEERVGLAVERTLDLPVGLLGILAAGAGFLPLDPTLPTERLEWLLEDAGVQVLVTQSALAPRLPARGRRLVLLDGHAAEIARLSPEPPEREILPDQLAWVIYTSGSTGRPKGTLVPHRGVPSLVAAQRRQLGVGAGSRVLQFSSLSFDASILDFITALAGGGCLCLASREEVMPGAPLVEVLRRERITHITIPPSALAVVPAAALPDLQVMCAGGEACPVELLDRWGPGRRFFNLYGPTEVTICCTMAECRPGEGPPSIGRPIPNTRVHLLDRRGQPVPVGVAGEMYLGGPGLARGYLNRPDLTAEKLVPDPWSPEPGERLYRTGDLARRRSDGALEFIGRADHQVKIRGFRIEPGEIEAALRSHPALCDAAVVAREDHAGALRLVAYVAPAVAGETPLSTAELRAFLAGVLPDYMIPALFVTLPRLPVNASGKVDRRALPAPEMERPDLAASYTAPRNPREKSLAALWSSLLGVERVGVHDNFFELGGHSLLLTRMLERLHTGEGRDVPVTALFQHSTVAALAAYLDPPETPVVSQQVDDRVRRQRAALLAQRALQVGSRRVSATDRRNVSDVFG